MKFRFFTVVFLLLFSWNAQGQADSLLELFSRSKENIPDRLSNEMIDALRAMPLEQADSLVAKTIASVEPISLACAELYRQRAFVHRYTKKTATGIAYLRRALEIATKLNNARLLGYCNLDLGIYYRELGLYSISAQYITDAANTFSKEKDPATTGLSFYEASLTNYQAGLFKNSISAHRKSIEHYKKINWDSLQPVDIFYLMSGYNTNGLAYYKLKKYDSAILYYNRADSIARRDNNVFWQKLIEGNIGEVFLKQGKANQALPLLRADYLEMAQQDDPTLSLSAGLNIVECFLALNAADSALYLLGRLNVRGATQNVQERYWRVASEVHGKSNKQAALASLRRALEMRDSALLNAEAVNLDIFKSIYEVQQKDESIRQLSLDVAEKQAKLQRQVNFTLTSVTFLFFAVIFSIMFYRFNSKNKSQLKIITEQTDAIDQQNHELEAQSQMLLTLNQTLQEKNGAIGKQKEKIELQNQKLREAFDEQKNTQSKLIQIEKMAALGLVTAGIAHEINNPLNFISGGVDALADPVEELIRYARLGNGEKTDTNRINSLEQDARELIKAIRNGVHRSNQIVSSLRSFSSPQESSWSTITPPDIIGPALTILSSKVKQHKIEITQKCDKGITLFGNASQLVQVVINLTDNAIQALQETEPPRKIRIAVTATNHQVEITIADNGSGIPQELQHKIFDPFFTTKPIGKGTGLGLAITCAIIEKHKGTINFTSKPGRGTEFRITLPV